MIPVGYMAKTISERPDWLSIPTVKHILSVSNCISEDFADYIDFWQHNSFWLFNSPQLILSLASQHQLSLAGCRWFYYEAYEREYDADSNSWNCFHPEASFPTDIEVPRDISFRGFDIVTNTCGQMVECSPLSCNGAATEVAVNSDCLLNSFEEAHEFCAEGVSGCEPGPYRILSVSEIQPPRTSAGEQ